MSAAFTLNDVQYHILPFEEDVEDLGFVDRMFDGSIDVAPTGTATHARVWPLRTDPVLTSPADGWTLIQTLATPGTHTIGGFVVGDPVEVRVRDVSYADGPVAMRSVSFVCVEHDPDGVTAEPDP